VYCVRTEGGVSMRRKGPLVRDVELMGHHRECDCSLESMDRDENHVCTCYQLDLDDYIDAGDRAYHEMIENPRKVVDDE
jgi:hypothetical protein